VVKIEFQEEKVKNNFNFSLHLVLKDLIEEKSNRDQVKFTSSQLATALCMPRSMITKLTHPDESKRVMNPRIDTLLKIVDFFRADGFNITIDDLLGITKKSVDVQEQNILSQSIIKKIPLYSFNAISNKKIGTIDIKTSCKSRNLLAYYTNEDIKPFFKKGSIFIIDKDQQLDDDTLVAILSKKTMEIKIKKYHIENKKQILKPLDPSDKQIIIPNQFFEVVGVVIQVNAKT